MCGIVGAVAQRNVVEILVEGLRRLEYRGYDSAGVALVNEKQALSVARTAGKVSALEALLRPALRKRKRRRPRWETFVASLARRVFGMDVVEVNETTEEVGSRPRMQMLAVVVVVV